MAEPEQDGEQDQAHDEGVKPDGDRQDHSHFLGCEWSREGEGQEDSDHDRGGRDDNPARRMQRPDYGVPRVAISLIALLGRREKEQRVVHGDAEHHGAKEERSPGVNVPLGGEAEKAGQMPVLEDEARHAKGTGERQRRGENPGGCDRGAPSATSNNRKPISPSTPKTSAVLVDRACCRS